MDMLKAASPFTRKNPFSAGEEFLRFVHLVEGRIYACTGLTAVEFKVGQTSLPGIALTPEDIAVLTAFRQEVTHISIGEERVVFRFASGEKYEASLISYPADRWRREFDKYWRMGNDLFDAATNRNQFLEQFSALPANSRIEVRPDGFVGYALDTYGYKIILEADTRATETLLFKAPELLLFSMRRLRPIDVPLA